MYRLQKIRCVWASLIRRVMSPVALPPKLSVLLPAVPDSLRRKVAGGGVYPSSAGGETGGATGGAAGRCSTWNQGGNSMPGGTGTEGGTNSVMPAGGVKSSGIGVIGVQVFSEVDERADGTRFALAIQQEMLHGAEMAGGHGSRHIGALRQVEARVEQGRRRPILVDAELAEMIVGRDA